MNCSEILPYGRHFWLNGCYYYSCRWKKASHQRGTHTHAHHKWKTIERSHVTRMKTKLILFNINTATNRRHSQQQRTERSWERKKAHLKWIHPIFSYYSSETHVTCMCERDGVVRFFSFCLRQSSLLDIAHSQKTTLITVFGIVPNKYFVFSFVVDAAAVVVVVGGDDVVVCLPLYIYIRLLQIFIHTLSQYWICKRCLIYAIVSPFNT